MGLNRRSNLSEILLALILLSGSAAFGAELRLKLPVACEVGRSCYIQNYVDVDPSSAAMDYQCGTLTYDGHNGTDFRLPSQQPNVAVLAAADGQVVRARDGISDLAVKGDDHSEVTGHECGNGVVIAHLQNWETQYCHMAKGSVRVKPGDNVTAGQMLGHIGLSGLTEYPHLHFMLRRDGKIVDPFASDRPPGSCNGRAENLWDAALREQLGYQPRTILNSGFTTNTVTNGAVESGEVNRRRPATDSQAIVVFVRAIGLKAGDVQALTLRDPAGEIMAENRAPALGRNKAQVILFAGKKRVNLSWNEGTYTATYVVSRGDTLQLEKRFQFDLR